MQAIRNRPRPETPDETPVAIDGCTCFRLRALARLTGRRFDATMAAAGLKTTQYSLLSTLARRGPMVAAELAQVLAVEPSTLTRNVEPLIRAGWVESSVGTDRRTRLLGLTAAGRQRRDEAKLCWLDAQADIERVLGDERVAALHQLLDECRDLLDLADADADGDPVVDGDPVADGDPAPDGEVVVESTSRPSSSRPPRPSPRTRRS